MVDKELLKGVEPFCKREDLFVLDDEKEKEMQKG